MGRSNQIFKNVRHRFRAISFAWKRRRCKHPYSPVIAILKEEFADQDLIDMSTGEIITIEKAHARRVIKRACKYCGYTWIETEFWTKLK